MQCQFGAGTQLMSMFREKYRQLARYSSKEPEEFAVRLLELGVFQQTCLKVDWKSLVHTNLLVNPKTYVAKI